MTLGIFRLSVIDLLARMRRLQSSIEDHGPSEELPICYHISAGHLVKEAEAFEIKVHWQ